MYVCMYVCMYHKQSQLHKDESNVQYSQAADREIELIPKNVSPVLQLLSLGHSMDHHKRKQQQLTKT